MGWDEPMADLETNYAGTKYIHIDHNITCQGSRYIQSWKIFAEKAGWVRVGLFRPLSSAPDNTQFECIGKNTLTATGPGEVVSFPTLLTDRPTDRLTD